MSFNPRLLRVPALLLAALALPCCSGDVGEGDAYKTITFRASETTTGLQANGTSFGGSFSEDGLFFAFQSNASNLTDNDANGLTDVLVRNRLTGELENITNIDVAGTGLSMGNAMESSMSATGRYVGFTSYGHYKDVGYVPGGAPALRPFRYDRELKTFAMVYGYLTTPPWFLNTHCGGVVLSDDGRYMAFSTPSVVPGTTNPGGGSQVYFCDFGPTGDTPELTLVSHANGSPAQGGNNAGSSIRSGAAAMSGDGEFVVFESASTDLVSGADPHSGQDVYLWRRSTGTVTLVSLPSSSQRYSAYPAISKDGSRVAYASADTTLFPGVPYLCQLYTVGTGLLQTISDPVVGGNSSQVALSRDGTRVIFGTGAFGAPQQDLWIEGVGIQRLSRSTVGKTTTVSTNSPAISGDGLWASWAGTSSIFVPNDTNGISDVFIRGPF